MSRFSTQNLFFTELSAKICHEIFQCPVIFAKNVDFANLLYTRIDAKALI